MEELEERYIELYDKYERREISNIELEEMNVIQSIINPEEYYDNINAEQKKYFEY